MKKYLLLWTLFMGLSLSFAAVKPGENILINGEFSGQATDPVTGLENKSPDFWGASGSTDSASFIPDGAPGKKGIVRLTQITPDKLGQEVVVSQTALTLVPGEKYRISALVRTKGFQSPHCGIIVYDDGWHNSFGISKFPKDQDWTPMTYEFTMFKSRTFTAALFACNFKGTLDISDVKLEALTEKGQQNSSPSAIAQFLQEAKLIPWTPLLNQIAIPENSMFSWLTGTRYPEMSFRFSGKLEPATVFADYDLRYAVNGLPEASQILAEGINTIQFKSDVTPGDFTLTLRIVNRKTGTVLCDQKQNATFVTAPRLSSKGHRRLNNLVVELLDTSFKRTAKEQTFEFCTFRNGWVFIAAQNAAAETLEITLDGQLTVIKNDTPRLETFREIPMGPHTLTVKGAVNGGTLVVRSIPEIFNWTPDVSKIPENPRYDWAYFEKHAHHALTTHNCGYHSSVPAVTRKAFYERGYKWTAGAGTSFVSADNLTSKLIRSEKSVKPFYHGISCDEQFFGNFNSIIPFTNGLKRYDAPKGYIIYTWVTGRPAYPGPDNDFLATCLNTSHGHGRVLSEFYCTTKPTFEEARLSLEDRVANCARSFRQFHPEIINQWGLIFGNFIQIPIISLAHHPHVDYKYYLDMQFNLIANHPECKDMGITGYWGTPFCDDEMFRWSFMLTRHYCIEGKTTMLSDEYGFSYAPGHIANNDFINGLADWTATGNVTTATAPDFGRRSQNRYASPKGTGDTLAVLTKQADETSTLSQVARGLVPGKTYCLQFSVIDYNALKKGEFITGKYPVGISLSDGAEINQGLSWIHIDKREKGQYAHNNNVPRINLHHIVFKAVKPEATITFDNAQAKPGDALAVNYVMLNPYLVEK